MSADIQIERVSYAPGELLRAKVQLLPLAAHETRRVELAVLWETEGKGDTDQGVILYRVLSEGDPQAGTAEHEVEVTLPALPLSYDGSIVKVGWRLRVRRLAPFGADAITDEPFLLTWGETG